MDYYNTDNIYESVYETYRAPNYVPHYSTYRSHYDPRNKEPHYNSENNESCYSHKNKLQKEYHDIKTCKLESIKKVRTPSIEDLDLYDLAHGLNTKEWNPRYKPITLSGSVFDLGSFGSWLIGWCNHCYGRNAINAEIVHKFASYALELSLHDQAIRECENNTDDIVTKSLMNELRITANVGYLKIALSIQDSFDLTEKDKGKTCLTEKSIRAFLDKYTLNKENIEELEAIIKLIVDWLDRVAVLAPHLC